MKCLIFSDSHNCSQYMKKAINLNRDADVVFFLGDGISDIDELSYAYSTIKFLAVRGNCDMRMVAFNSIIQKTAEIELCGKKIVYTHGDLYGAKYGTAGLCKLAVDKNADIVLFGHTHIPAAEYISEYGAPFYLFNPGSIGTAERSYGILTLTEGQEPLFSHGCFL